MNDLELIGATNTVSTVLWITMLLGLVLLVFFVMLIKQAITLNSLNKYRSNKKGMADLLNWSALVDNGILVQKNGSLLRAWVYEGPDETMLGVSDKNYISERLNDIFKSFDSGWVVHVDAIRRPVPNYFKKSESAFPNKIAEAIDQERRNFFSTKGSMYDGMFIFTVTWYPPKLTTRKFAEAMFEKDGSEKITKYKRTNDLILEFKDKTAFIEGELNNIFKEVTPLVSYEVPQIDGSTKTYDALLAYLNFTITGSWDPVLLPKSPAYIDDLLAKDLDFGIVPVVDSNYIAVVAIDSLPAETSPGIFNYLTELGCTYRWSSRYIGLETHEAASAMKKLRRGWEQKQRGFFTQLFHLPGGKVNLDAVAMVEEADYADAMISRGDVSFGYMTDNIILMDHSITKVKAYANDIKKMLAAYGITARIETLNAMDAWLGSLPGHAAENVRRPLISSMNVADMLPVYSPWLGSIKAPCPMPGYVNAPGLMMCVTGDNMNTPFALNLHEGDLGHTLILGPTGAGKSTLLGTLVAQFMRYQDMNIFAFDKGMSMYTLCKATGGSHYIPGGENSDLAFAPLNNLETAADRAWANQWLQDIAILNDIKVTPTMVKQIDDCLKTMMSNKKETDGYQITLSNFVGEIQNDELRDVLTQYLSDSAIGSLIDSQKDNLGDLSKTLSVFEIEALMSMQNKYSLPVLTYLFHCIEKSLKGQPALIVLDEAWLMLSNEAFSDKIKEWLKVLRKANCAVILATQSLTDVVNSPIMDVLIESCPTKIFLPNPEAKQDNMYKLYKRFSLNDTQIKLIAEGRKKKDYFFFNGLHSRMFQLALEPFTLAFVAVSDKKSIQKIDKLIAKYGEDDWVDKYLEKKNIDYPKEA